MSVNYPKERDLDGVYFRVCRDGEWGPVCFTDLTNPEQDKVLLGRSEEWLRNMCKILAATIRDIGDQLDLVRK